MYSWWRQRPYVRPLSAAPIPVDSEEEYLENCYSGILLTTSGSEPHTDMTYSLVEYSLRGTPLSPREIYTFV